MTATTTKPFITDDYRDFPVGVRFGRANEERDGRHETDLGVWALRESGVYDYAHDAAPRPSEAYADGTWIEGFEPFIALDPMPSEDIKPGTKVRIVNYSDDLDGTIGVVADPALSAMGTFLRVRIEGDGTYLMLDNEVELVTEDKATVDPAKAPSDFKAGDKVRITGPLQTHTGEEVYGFREGDEAEVADTDSSNTGYGSGSVLIVSPPYRRGQWIDPASLEKATETAPEKFDSPEDAPKDALLKDKDGDFWKYNESEGEWHHSFDYDGEDFSFLEPCEEYAPYTVVKILEEPEGMLWSEIAPGSIVKSLKTGGYLLKSGPVALFTEGCNKITEGWVSLDDPGHFAPFVYVEATVK